MKIKNLTETFPQVLIHFLLWNWPVIWIQNDLLTPQQSTDKRALCLWQ